MACGWHYTKLSLSRALLSFSGMCILWLFLSFCRFCFVSLCFYFWSRLSFVDVPMIIFCPADNVPDWQPRILLSMVEARSVNVKKTTTTTYPTGKLRQMMLRYLGFMRDLPYGQQQLLLLLIHTFSVLSLQVNRSTVTHRSATYQRVTSSGCNPLLKPIGIQIATKNVWTTG